MLKWDGSNLDEIMDNASLKKHPQKSHIGTPLVTIITATFNAEDHFSRTINSIRNLTYKNIEWIVVDGKSSDKTVELIQENDDVITYWISEADRGIYDAWNKGLLKANGDWVAFLGAGDTYETDSIANYMELIAQSSFKPDFVCSRVRLVNNLNYVLREIGGSFDWYLFKNHMVIAHVGALHNKSLFKKFGYFDTKYKVCADYDFLMRCGSKLHTLYLDRVTANMLVGGASNGYRCLYETYVIQRSFGAGFSAKTRYLIACAKRFVRPLLRGY
jgi:glycosyltransferase involved in cell wall biosynthesis